MALGLRIEDFVPETQNSPLFFLQAAKQIKTQWKFAETKYLFHIKET